MKLHTIALIASLLVSASALAANPEPMDIDAEILAKIAKEKLKGSKDRNKSDAEKGILGNDSAGCGNVDIGNVIGARPGFVPRNITVVITGDVINANNKCR